MADTFGEAYFKAQEAAQQTLPMEGAVLITVAETDRPAVIEAARQFAELGFTILATEGTSSMLSLHGVEAMPVRKFSQGPGPNGEPTIVDLIREGKVDLIFNTPSGETLGGSPRRDGYEIRTAAVLHDVAAITTVQGLEAAVQGIEAVREGTISVRSLQDWAKQIKQSRKR